MTLMLMTYKNTQCMKEHDHRKKQTLCMQQASLEKTTRYEIRLIEQGLNVPAQAANKLKRVKEKYKM